MTNTHPLNRHIFIADNLDLLKSLDNETIDLVCCDPPFAKNQTFKGAIKPALTDSEIAAEKSLMKSWGIETADAAEAAGLLWPYDQARNDAWFKDIWRYKKVVHEDWITQLEDDWQPVADIIKLAAKCHGENMAAYLIYMAVRIIEIRRVLKPTGAFYIHCDQTASHYLKLLLDGIFGEENFRNEIVWCYKRMPSKAYRFQKQHDTILFYSASERHNEAFNVLKAEIAESSAKTYKTARKRGYNVNLSKGMITVFDWDKYNAAVAEGKLPADAKPVEFSEEGPPERDWWDMPILSPGSDERTGYPTQKPVALAERIILAATKPGDVVLDPFAGCAYVPVAAEKNKRQWIACDISIRALTVLKRQFQKFDYSVDGETSEDKIGIAIAETFSRSPFALPDRTDEDPVETPKLKAPPPSDDYYKKSDMPVKEMTRRLLELSGYQAWCCGFANRRHDGSVIKTTNNFHLDHIDPKSEGGTNRLENRAPLCQAHNQTKKNRQITLAQLRKEIAASEEGFHVPEEDLVNLSEAKAKAVNILIDIEAEKKAAKPELDLQM